MPARRKASAPVADSYANVAASLGLTQNNLSAAASYALNPVSRNRLLLENAYRGSWIVRVAVDAIPDDMTREGIDLQDDLAPDEITQIQGAIKSLNIWTAINRTMRWARLYGGAVGVILIDGHDLATPLRVDTIGKDQFKGICPLDRWMINPSLGDLVTEYGPHLGKPKYYDVTVTGGTLPRGRIHYWRCIRMEGDDLPYFQKQMENAWGVSVLEPIYDRLTAFDSTSTGVAQLVFKAHLRTLKMAGLRKAIATGGASWTGIKSRIDALRLFQSIEGLTVTDKDEEEFETHTYTFAGLSDVMLQFAQQLSGALGVPMVRLFGQSPAGLNSSGESDLRTYYDMIKNTQETDLRDPLTMIVDIIHRSVLGREPAPEFAFEFRSLWQQSHNEKADVGGKITDAVLKAYDAGVVDRATALRELKQQSRVTNIWSNIDDKLIEDAENDPPPVPVQGGEQEIGPDGQPLVPGAPKPPEPKLPRKIPLGETDRFPEFLQAQTDEQRQAIEEAAKAVRARRQAGFV